MRSTLTLLLLSSVSLGADAPKAPKLPELAAGYDRMVISVMNYSLDQARAAVEKSGNTKAAQGLATHITNYEAAVERRVSNAFLKDDLIDVFAAWCYVAEVGAKGRKFPLTRYQERQVIQCTKWLLDQSESRTEEGSDARQEITACRTKLRPVMTKVASHPPLSYNEQQVLIASLLKGLELNDETAVAAESTTHSNNSYEEDGSVSATR